LSHYPSFKNTVRTQPGRLNFGVLKSHSIRDSNFVINSNSLKATELYWRRKHAYMFTWVDLLGMCSALQTRASTRFLPDKQTWKPRADGAVFYYCAARHCHQVDYSAKQTQSLSIVTVLVIELPL